MSYTEKEAKILMAMVEMGKESNRRVLPEDLVEKVGMTLDEVTEILNNLEREYLEGIKQNQSNGNSSPIISGGTFSNNVFGVVVGNNNTFDNITQINDPKFSNAINELLDGIEKSSLSPAQKIALKSDVQSIKELAQLEKNEEVRELANSKIEAISDVIAKTADMTSLGMVVIPILHAMFQ